MGDVIEFPTRPAHQGQCSLCGREVKVATSAAWPQQCPYCRNTPFVLVSGTLAKPKSEA